MFGALLDTCTLWPSLRRDVLLSFAAEGLYRPLWSTTVLEELQETEMQKLVSAGVDPEEAELRALRLIQQMRVAFDDSEVPEGAYKSMEGTFGLPDPNDEHVVAAAVIGQAGGHRYRDSQGLSRPVLAIRIDCHSSERVSLRQRSDQ